jgi:hypothetical protein
MRVMAKPDSPLNTLPRPVGTLESHHAIRVRLDNGREYRVAFCGDHPRLVDVIIPARVGRREVWRNLWYNGPEGLAPIGRTAALAVVRAESRLPSYGDDSNLPSGYRLNYREREITKTKGSGKAPLPWSFFHRDGTLRDGFLTRAMAIRAARDHAIRLGRISD